MFKIIDEFGTQLFVLETTGFNGTVGVPLFRFHRCDR